MKFLLLSYTNIAFLILILLLRLSLIKLSQSCEFKLDILGVSLILKGR